MSPGRPIWTPGGPGIPIAASLIALILVSAVERRVFLAGAVGLAVGALGFAYNRPPRNREG